MATKIKASNLGSSATTAITNIVTENSVDSALVNGLIDSAFTVKSTTDLSEGSNLYYTTSRGDSDTGDYIAGNRTYGNITTTGYIAGPATFTIDPAAVGDNTGTLVVAGNLQVDGTTTTINSTTMEVDDLNITLASGAANAAAANGAGITVDGASATITYGSTSDSWSFNKNVGIGTSSPVAKLDVLAGTDERLLFTYNSGTSLISSVNAANTAYNELYLNGSDIRFGTSLSEKMRIDSSGNVLVGKTASNVAAEGVEIRPSGFTGLTVDGGAGLTIRRLTSDGELQSFFKDTTKVGSIGSASSGGVFDISGAANDVRITGGNASYWLDNSAVYAGNNASRDLGTSSFAWKDLYLSGTANVGNLQTTSIGRIFSGNGGNASNPMIANVSDQNTGIYFPAADNMALSTGGSERLRIDGAGNVTIQPAGTTIRSFGETVAIKKDQSGPTRLSVRNDTNDSNSSAGVTVSAAGNSWTVECGSSVKNGNDLTFALDATAGTPSEKMRLTTSGVLNINQTASTGGKLNVSNSSGSWVATWVDAQENGNYFEFRDSGGNTHGTITASGTGVSYNTASDIRLKTDIKPILNAAEKLMAMNAVTHKWKDNPESDAVHGFIAQEMVDIIPEAVSQGKEEDDTWSMDYGRITPIIVAALQDALKEIDMLKNRIAELEAK